MKKPLAETLLNVTPEISALIDTIRTEIETGKTNARLAVEREKKLTYWAVGQHIKEHLLKHANRAEYGEQLILLLAEHLGMGARNLYLCVQFFESYPQILHARAELSWTHIKVLLTLPKEERAHYENKIIDDQLSTRDLTMLIKTDKGSPKTSAPPTLKQHHKEPFTYVLKTIQNVTMVDLGFRMYTKSPIQTTKTDTVIKATKNGKTYKFHFSDTHAIPHYTYKAYLIDVLDGDTIWVDIDLGFDTWTRQKLRFRGINAPSLETAEGIAAKDYVISQLKGCPFIAIKTYGRDKFTRYLADIFYEKGKADLMTVAEDGNFLNQELLDNGFGSAY